MAAQGIVLGFKDGFAMARAEMLDMEYVESLLTNNPRPGQHFDQNKEELKKTMDARGEVTNRITYAAGIGIGVMTFCARHPVRTHDL